MKIIFTSPILRHPARGGPALRIENSIKALSKIADVHVICRVPYEEAGGKQAVDFYSTKCSEFCFTLGRRAWWTPWRRVGAMRLKIRNPIIYAIANSPMIALNLLRGLSVKLFDEAGFLVSYARRHKISVLWFGYGHNSYALIKRVKKLAPDLRIVCDTDSVWSRFLLRELPYQRDSKKRRKIERLGRAKEWEEKALMSLCELTTAVSDVDADYYRTIAPRESSVRVFSNVVDMATYYPNTAPIVFKRPSLYLAGSFGPGSPMENAARWFLGEVMPLVEIKWPTVHFYIIGSGSLGVLSDVRRQNVSVIGEVPSVLPYLWNADVVVVPLWFESGTRFKILEAGACRRPVVSTTLGAEGLAVHHGDDILLADTPDSFAEAISWLLSEPMHAASLGGNLYELVARDYSIEALIREGTVILDQAVPAGAGR